MGFQDFWSYLYRDIYRENDFRFAVGGTFLVTFSLFYGLCGFLAFVDLYGKPKWMLKYKTQPGTNPLVSMQKLQRALKVVTINQFFVSAPYLLLTYPLRRYMGASCRPEDLPTIFHFIRDIAFCILVDEICFYYTHRLFHWGPLYRRFHKLHHEWTAPVGLVCVYAHPVEHVVCNLVPFSLGGILLGSHMVTNLSWTVIGLMGTIIQHSGYHLPWLLSPEAHDYHHLKFNCNYGAIGLLDWLHGTDGLFRDSPQFKRHQVLRGLRAMTSLFPDQSKVDIKTD